MLGDRRTAPATGERPRWQPGSRPVDGQRVEVQREVPVVRSLVRRALREWGRRGSTGPLSEGPWELEVNENGRDASVLELRQRVRRIEVEQTRAALETAADDLEQRLSRRWLGADW